MKMDKMRTDTNNMLKSLNRILIETERILSLYLNSFFTRGKKNSGKSE